ncbi:LacI family DNA-binding transcriptional regulator [Glycomyces sp. NPDC046736]|uniref:LacI family DNA-binding transcriptional regulator n=1 Tax=Glycomyces sp. NPDC046736 TaxID=3155615 RepID=UPI00340766F0
MTANRNRRPTIVDVAAHAGVSKSLVSLALRGDDGVGPSTRDRILRSAAELGYRLNAQARALVQGRTGQIGVIVTDLRNPYHAEVALGVEESAEDEGFGTFLANGRRDPKRLAAQVEAMIGHNVEGLVVVSSRVDSEVLAAAARRLPIVVVGRPEVLPEGVDSVANDDLDGARQAAEHLITLGHKEIAFATTSNRPAARARLEGYETTLQAAALKPSIHRLRPEPGAIDEILSSGATAIMANNDVLAIECLGRAHELGLDVPGRLSLIGYDDTELAARSWPRLTSIDQHCPDLGRTALTLLKTRLEGRTADRHEVISPTLVKRASTAAVTD